MRKGILMILDGYGEGKPNEYNAVDNANTPFLKEIKKKSHSLLKTDGEAVGIFEGEMGGSEVGHTTIGAGRIVPSTAKKINDDVKSGVFEHNEQVLNVFKQLKANEGNLHIVGLSSDKNIHSNIFHSFKIMDMAEPYTNHIYYHIITDGRDTGSKDSLKYLTLIESEIAKHKNAEIASVSGRGYALDREGNLDRTEKAVKCMFEADDGIPANKIRDYLRSEHDSGKDDQFVEPVHVNTHSSAKIAKNDVVFIYNFREDRLRQIGKAINKYGCRLITMASVAGVESVVLYKANITRHTLSEHLSDLGLSQVKISETTKYAHVTYFLNGGEETAFPKEDRVHIPTIKVKVFSETPKMRAQEISEETLKAIDKNYDAIIVNFSNPDMIGHTGDYEATVESLEFLDGCVKKIADYAKQHDYFMIVTADHGNSEEMRMPDGSPHMAHTLNKVACVVLDDKEYKMKEFGGLQDVAPTFLKLMEVPENPYFEGTSLI